MDPAAATDSFSVITLFMQADWVIKLIMLVLAAASLWSWALIIDKLIRFAGLNREANAFEDKIAAGRSLEDIAAEAGERPVHPLPRMLQAALREWRDARAKAAMNDTQAVLLIQRVDRVMDSVIAREGARAEEGLGSLAIIATSSPFIGLLGTVWGIMVAFREIGIQQNTSLAVVAPSIAEALFATAIGLTAAIPAYVAYNKFSTDAGKFTGRLEGFADDLSTAIARRAAGQG
jgi:biopolymer transport protein TolQ